MTHADGLPCDLGPGAVRGPSDPGTARGSLAVALQLPLLPYSSLADALAPGRRSAHDGAARQRRETDAINQKAPPNRGGSGGTRPPRPRHPLAPRPGAAGAQQQPFFFPDLVLTFLLPSFLDFLDFLVATASAAPSTAASTTGGAPPMAMASAWSSSSVTATPDMIFWNISGEMFMRC